MQQREHWKELDGLRGVLALGVVLFHFGFNSFTARHGWAGVQFPLAVDVFFLLSGFVLAYSARNGIDPGRFLYRRFWRLSPVFYITLLMAVLVSSDEPHPLEALAAVPWLGQTPINSPSWSVSWEFYLPVIAVLSGVRIPQKAVRPLLVLSLVGLGLADIWVETLWVYPLRALFGLSGGYLLYRSGFDLKVPMLLPVGLLGLSMTAAQYAPVVAFTAPFFACASILAGRHSNTALSTPPIQLLGTLSYTLYLAHMPVFMLMEQVANVDQNPLAKVVALVISLAVAGILTVCVERPLMRGFRRLPAASAP
ncbi:hypothetical protein PK98_00555 [Croceibacterium mercuriale]|uniref:Acyltransferase 3 domain-containing protein n=1 Tax=Croceibacterium mercuriale TaxID=1572751 RepID=A0A0B2BV46_9SPHN|nr:acyltransferase [Croceibacterium mercuriale]KHL25279.1 hypothetical protein PK98_00555 [Croceibacterium mercuriale]